MTTRNPHYEAGSALTAIRRSEKSAQSASNAAWKRHQQRCEAIIAPLSDDAKRILAVTVPGPIEPLDDNEPDAYAIAPSLLKEPEPMTGVVEKRRA